MTPYERASIERSVEIAAAKEALWKLYQMRAEGVRMPTPGIYVRSAKKTGGSVPRVAKE